MTGGSRQGEGNAKNSTHTNANFDNPEDRTSSSKESRDRAGEEREEGPPNLDPTPTTIPVTEDPIQIDKFTERLESAFQSAMESQTHSQFMRRLSTLSRCAHVLTEIATKDGALAAVHIPNLTYYRKQLLVKLQTFPDLSKGHREFALGVLRCAGLHGTFVESVREKSEDK